MGGGGQLGPSWSTDLCEAGEIFPDLLWPWLWTQQMEGFTWTLRHHLNSVPSYTSTISSPSAILTNIFSFSFTLLTCRRCCMLVLMRVARLPRRENSIVRTSGGTSSFSTPRISIRDAATDAAVVMALL